MALSTKNKKYIYWSASFISLTIILLSVYSLLGGFEKVNTSKSSGSSYSIAGKWIKGVDVRKEEGKVFYDLKQAVQDKKLLGLLCMIDFKNDSLQENEVVHFMGVILENEVSALPSDLEILELSAKRTYQASLTMHPLVMPNTRKVETKLEELASTNGDTLQPFTIEMFFNDNSLLVEVFAF